jgi:WD40 repeat protein
MILILNVLFLLVSSQASKACEFKWEKLPIKTPLSDQKVRPQGLTFFKNYLVLSNHFKDSKTNNNLSQLYFYRVPEIVLEKVLSFPETFHHIGGLASNHENIYAVDFDKTGLYEINVPSSFKSNQVELRKILDLGIAGPSGLSIYQDIVAVSYYIIPYKEPYFQDRTIQFYKISTGEKIKFLEGFKDSNYSQGLSFFNNHEKLYLAESINEFSNVLKYKITGNDFKPDTIRLYSLDLDKKIFSHVSDTSIPSTMVEDLSFDGQYL